MTPIVAITGIVALYIFMLAAFAGYEVIAKVPVILHTPLMSGSNFVHGIVLVGAMVALGNAHTTLEKVIGAVGVFMAAGNAAGGYVVTERMLEMFKSSKHGQHGPDRRARHGRKTHLMNRRRLAPVTLISGELPARRVPVHHRPEAHEFPRHGPGRHRLGGCRDGGGHGGHLPVTPGFKQLRVADIARQSPWAAAWPGVSWTGASP